MKTEPRWAPELATIRLKKGVSLEQIACDTKIRVYYLHAIEKGEFGKLPGGIYNVSYIRQYAKAIDYDEFELLERYYNETDTRPEPPEAETPGRKSASGFLGQLTRVLG